MRQARTGIAEQGHLVCRLQEWNRAMNHPLVAIVALAGSILFVAWSFASGIEAQMRIDAAAVRHVRFEVVR